MIGEYPDKWLLNTVLEQDWEEEDIILNWTAMKASWIGYIY